MVATLREAPATDPAQRRAEWGQVAVVAGIWALLIGTGLGSTGLVALGGLCFLAAAGFAALGGAATFALLTLFIAAVGITPYLYLYIRSAQNPPINEAAPATFDALLAVIRRAQYPPRTPLDNPTVSHGPDNPGRTLAILGIQFADYIVYFTWQWAKALAEWLQVLVTLVFVSLGLRGLLAQRRADRPAWWLLLGLFMVTGPGLVIYMNFRPGFGRWFESYPDRLRSRGARARLLLCGELHRVGDLGGDGAGGGRTGHLGSRRQPRDDGRPPCWPSPWFPSP